MVVFHKLCGAAWSSRVHKTESFSAMETHSRRLWVPHGQTRNSETPSFIFRCSWASCYCYWLWNYKRAHMWHLEKLETYDRNPNKYIFVILDGICFEVWKTCLFVICVYVLDTPEFVLRQYFVPYILLSREWAVMLWVSSLSPNIFSVPAQKEAESTSDRYWVRSQFHVVQKS